MSAGAVIIIIGPRPNRVVGNIEYAGSTDNVVISISGLLEDATNGEVAGSLADALATLDGANPSERWVSQS